MSEWPGGARGALSLTCDNLGEAAEIGVGALSPDSPSIGTHFTATRVAPWLLGELGSRDLAATFFVEGINAEHYPELLREIGGAGHEIGYHAWHHETWADLPAASQAANLERGLTAFRDLGLDPVGLRPPGGGLGAGGVEVLRGAGLRYCSPAGAGPGWTEGVALIPFRWRHVDASCLLPGLGAVRTEISGGEDPVEPDAFVASIEAEIDRTAGEGGLLVLVLHLSLVDWLGQDRIGGLLDRAAAAARDDGLWVARCAEVADHIGADPGRYEGGTELDPRTWSAAAG